MAGLGWVCVGGKLDGDLAFIRLNNKENDSRFRVSSTSSSDLSRNTTRKTLPGVGENDTDARSFPELVLDKFGSAIVNSITLHELSNRGKSQWDEPVALLR